MGAPTPAAPHSHSGLRFRNRLGGALPLARRGAAPIHLKPTAAGSWDVAKGRLIASLLFDHARKLHEGDVERRGDPSDGCPRGIGLAALDSCHRGYGQAGVMSQGFLGAPVAGA